MINDRKYGSEDSRYGDYTVKVRQMQHDALDLYCFGQEKYKISQNQSNSADALFGESTLGMLYCDTTEQNLPKPNIFKNFFCNKDASKNEAARHVEVGEYSGNISDVTNATGSVKIDKIYRTEFHESDELIKCLYSCEFCGFKASKRHVLNHHTKTYNHKPQKPIFKCGKCSYCTVYETDLKKHAILVHVDGRFYCSCGFSSSEPDQLKVHMSRHSA